MVRKFANKLLARVSMSVMAQVFMPAVRNPPQKYDSEVLVALANLTGSVESVRRSRPCGRLWARFGWKLVPMPLAYPEGPLGAILIRAAGDGAR